MRYQKGDLEESIADFTRAVELDPSLASAYGQLQSAQERETATEYHWDRTTLAAAEQDVETGTQSKEELVVKVAAPGAKDDKEKEAAE